MLEGLLKDGSVLGDCGLPARRGQDAAGRAVPGVIARKGFKGQVGEGGAP